MGKGSNWQSNRVGRGDQKEMKRWPEVHQGNTGRDQMGNDRWKNTFEKSGVSQGSTLPLLTLGGSSNKGFLNSKVKLFHL